MPYISLLLQREKSHPKWLCCQRQESETAAPQGSRPRLRSGQRVGEETATRGLDPREKDGSAAYARLNLNGIQQGFVMYFPVFGALHSHILEANDFPMKISEKQI